MGGLVSAKNAQSRMSKNIGARMIEFVNTTGREETGRHLSTKGPTGNPSQRLIRLGLLSATLFVTDACTSLTTVRIVDLTLALRATTMTMISRYQFAGCAPVATKGGMQIMAKH